MSKRLSVAVQGWTSYRARVLCGPSAMPSPHTTCHPHGTLTTAILAKTENQVTQPTLPQAVPGLPR
ncbi:hypothetical protein XCCB1459_0134 [Xanthomonas campestris pv. campestris]|jgi:hypothetical protein|nr:hypothetical protein XCCB1459_0134 [Xanthomonas campestris pv. campestris]